MKLEPAAAGIEAAGKGAPSVRGDRDSDLKDSKTLHTAVTLL